MRPPSHLLRVDPRRFSTRLELPGLAVAIAFGGCSPAQGPSIHDLAGIKIAVHQQEAAVRFLRVRAFGTCADKRGGRDCLGETVVTVVRETDPVGRSLLDYELQTVQDAERCFRESMVFGFDGRVSWDLHRSTMQIGVNPAPVPMRSGTLQAGRRPPHNTEWVSGWRATLPGFHEERGRWFSEAMELPEAPFDLAFDQATGNAVLSCVSKAGTRDQWVLRREWEFCLGSHQCTDRDGTLRQRTEVLDAQRLVAGFWYPRGVRYEVFDSSGAIERTITADIVEVERLEAVPERLFAPTFPHGTAVTDHVTGTVVRVAGPDAEVEEALDGQASQVRALVDYDGGATRPAPAWHWWVAPPALALLAIGWVRWRASRRVQPVRRRHAANGTALLLLLPALAVAGPAAGQEPWVMEQLAGRKAANPGVEAMVLVARYFGQPLSLGAAAAAMSCGEGRTMVPNLARLCSGLGGCGFRCDTVRFADLESLIACARAAKGLGIIALDDGLPYSSYLVVAPSRRGLVVARPVGGARDHEFGDATMVDLANRLAGVALVVRPQEQLAPWKLDSEAFHHVSLGAVRLEPSTVDLPVRNDSGDPLSLLTSRSTCGCIEQVELLPACLGPGCTGSIRLHLVGSRMSATDRDQTVDLECGLGDRPAPRRLVVTARTGVPLPVARAAVVPALAESEGRSADRNQAFVSVIVPNGGSVVAVRGSNGVAATASVLRSVEGGVAVRHSVSWTGDRGWVEFVVRDDHGVDAAVHCDLRATATEDRTAAGVGR